MLVIKAILIECRMLLSLWKELLHAIAFIHHQVLHEPPQVALDVLLKPADTKMLFSLGKSN